jgi:hypothetical protein
MKNLVLRFRYTMAGKGKEFIYPGKKNVNKTFASNCAPPADKMAARLTKLQPSLSVKAQR